MRTIALTVEGMSCSHCENAVRMAVMALEGVKEVAVDLLGKKVILQCEAATPSKTAIRDAIEAQGYDVIE